jgi:hypothetical protein
MATTPAIGQGGEFDAAAESFVFVDDESDRDPRSPASPG